MNEHDFQAFGEDFGFSPSSASGMDPLGVYIPEIRDCMGCGMCVGVCPTYKARPEENYGPRGRVRLIEKVLVSNGTLEEEERAALDACTLCRACETVCPSKMDYAALYRQTVEATPLRPKQTPAIKLLINLLAPRRWAQRMAVGSIHVYQRSGLQRLFEMLPRSLLQGQFGQLNKLLPVPFVSQPVPRFSQGKSGAPHGEVALFTGCVANIFDTQTHSATIKVLTRLGHDVRVLEGQTCCGALYAHNGEIEKAKAYAEKNLAAISGSGARAILHNASGCGAFLREYPALLSDQGIQARQVADTLTTDVMDFLLGTTRLDELEFTQLDARVAVHEPCSQRNVLKNQDGIYEVLSKIPGLELVPLPGNEMCCGAGGTKALTQPELADPLRDQKVEALVRSGAGILVSTNLACAMHLSSGIRERGYPIEVLHPVSLIARQLR